ncbi:hypothetical protein N7530_010699 [Penicillium desertorum]|uniref:Uncharacterized protein n=1 Tax=Penicillium desertorum TaxID=1303715 RepID=A0A9W9WHX7_9EURO|nr:hypothetical protein N7530_010699 [Penicillium desertorum]
MGVAPAGANSHTFYLPLVAMYGRWCKMLGDPLPCPTMFNCTWISEGEDRGRFSWGHRLDGTSKRMPHGCSRDTPWSIALPPPKGSGSEIAPGISVTTHVEGNTNPGAVYGIAVHRKGVLHSQYEDGVLGWAWKAVRRLCANCEELVRMWGGLPANFEPFADMGGCHCTLDY